MKPSRLDAWVLARLVADLPVNGELQGVSPPFQTIARHLADLGRDDRRIALDGFLTGPFDRAAIIQALALDPEQPAPEAPVRRPASLADLRAVMSESQWLWPGWIASARLGGIAAAEGVGKTRFAMDLARRIWSGLPWPDGQIATFPERTPTLWACSDGQQDDLYAIAEACGMPDDSLFFHTRPEDIYAGLDLDDVETLPMIEEFIDQVRPGLVFIDSLTFATSRDLCKANDVMTLMTPLRDVAQRTQTSIISLLHVAKDGQALGKRIKGIKRTILQLECPDPDESARLRLSVFKTFAKKPPPLGVTMGDAGNEYDIAPPEPAERTKRRSGRPGTEREEAMQFVRESLTRTNGQVGTILRAKWHEAACERATQAGKPEPKDTGKTFRRALDDMMKAGELTETGGPGMGEQWALHLKSTDPESDHL